MPLSGLSIDWFTEFPQGNVGLWLALIASWGAFVVALLILRKKPSYIEFQDIWTIKYNQAANTVTVFGLVTIISLSTRMDATCRMHFGKVSALWLWYGRFGNPKGFDLALISREPHTASPNAYQLAFSGKNISIPDGPSEAAIAMRVKLGDGSAKRMTRRVALQSEDSTERS